MKDRLRMMRAAGVSRTLADVQTPPSAQPASEGPASLGGVLFGDTVSTPAGQTFRIDTYYPAQHRWGFYPLETALTVPPLGWQRTGRSAAFGSFDLRSAVFFDTETTGLSGGAGTRIFLAGLGYFEGDQFVVRQYFLRDYFEEPALLHALRQDLSGRGAIVSFNGRSFDWPLLATRYTFNRETTPLTGAPHLDLLYPARRVWRARLERCNLGSLEAAVLGLKREGDVPGSEIPGLYFDFLRTGDASAMAAVVDHNRQDIVSMVTLAGLLGHLAADPLGGGRRLAEQGGGLHGLDLLSLGRWLAEETDPSTGVGCYEAARSILNGAAARHAALALAQVHRRRGDFRTAAAIWRELTEGSLSVEPYVELAKHYEHREKNVSAARELVLQAMELWQRRRSLGSRMGTDPEWAKLTHRLARLDRKLAKEV